jgi:hypothetical protein
MWIGGTTALPAAAVVNTVSLGVFLAAVWVLARRAAGASTATAVTAIVGVTPAVHAAFRMTLSEAPFLAACGLALVALDTWRQAPAARGGASWLAALAIAAAIHLRYTGVFLVSLHLVVVAWALWRTPSLRPEAPRLAASVLAGPALGSAFLVHRMATLGCAFCEARPESSQSLVDSAWDLVLAAVRSLPLLYDVMPGPIDSIATGVLFLSLLAVGARGLTRRPRSDDGRVLALLVAQGAIYTVGLLVTRTLVEFNALDARLAAPAVLPLLAAGLIVALRDLPPRARIGLAVVMTTVLAVGVGAASANTGWRVVTEPARRQMPAVTFAERHLADQPGDLIFTPDVVYVLTHLGFDRPGFFLPSDVVPSLRPGERGVVVVGIGFAAAAPGTIAALDRIASRVDAGPDVLVWRLPEAGG